MFHVVLHRPEIPQNAGNVIRLCANTGARLHLVEPLGFHMEEKALRRAALDYREYAEVSVHAELDACLACIRRQSDPPGGTCYALTAGAVRPLHQARLRPGDVFVFGSESVGLPPQWLQRIPAAHRLRLPMCPGSRSLNLANAVAVVVYEAWRQADFAGAVEAAR